MIQCKPAWHLQYLAFSKMLSLNRILRFSFAGIARRYIICTFNITFPFEIITSVFWVYFGFRLTFIVSYLHKHKVCQLQFRFLMMKYNVFLATSLETNLHRVVLRRARKHGLYFCPLSERNIGAIVSQEEDFAR